MNECLTFIHGKTGRPFLCVYLIRTSKIPFLAVKKEVARLHQIMSRALGEHAHVSWYLKSGIKVF